jgi:NAD(P)-dependent dehydrogenase (short-subunit alcohol dehydrogenase family)
MDLSYTDTPMIQDPRAGEALGMQQYKANVPMGRLGQPDEVDETGFRWLKYSLLTNM